MLRIQNTEVSGLTRAIRASGNAMSIGEINTSLSSPIEEKDLKRASNLGNFPVGSAHDHFLVGIHVQFDICYPQYWTIEAERYHNFEIITSQSKMHKLSMMGKQDNFSSMFNQYVEPDIIKKIKTLIAMYNDTDGVLYPKDKYTLFMRCISNLPMGFEMWMTCDLTYLQIKTMCLQRKNHKLKEDWGEFCRWAVEELPVFSHLTGITLTKEKGE